MDHSLGKRKYAAGGAGGSSPKQNCVRAPFDFWNSSCAILTQPYAFNPFRGRAILHILSCGEKLADCPANKSCNYFSYRK